MRHPERTRDGKGGILKGDCVNLDEATVEVGPVQEEAQPAPSGQGDSPSETEVATVTGDDGRVEAIDVTCICGRNIHLTCEYMETENASENA